MGQQEIYKFLKQNKGKWFNSRELSKETDAAMSRVTNALRVMLRYEKGLERSQMRKKGTGYKWRLK